MAVQKALFTNQADFQKAKGIGSFSDDPFLSYDGDAWNDFTEKGNPGSVDGVNRKAKTFVTGMAYAPPGAGGPTTKTRHLISFFFKPTANDVANTGSNWRILFTHRGWSKTNYGLHLALYNGWLNTRIYGTGGLLEVYSQSAVYGMVERKLVAGQLYHVVFKYDEADPYSLEVYLNDDLWIYSGVKTANLNGITANYLTIGDMPTGTTGTKTYPLEGWIDEFLYFTGQHGSMPSIATLQGAYRNEMYDGQWMDWWTEPGSLMVGKSQIDGTYNQTKWTWTSSSVDLGDGAFGDFGRIQLNFEQPTGTFIEVFTRTSDDGQDWNAWIKIANDGVINSPDERYLQIKVDFWTIVDSATPKIMEIQVLDYPTKPRLTLTSEPLIIYRDLSTGLERVGELVNAYDIFITEEIIDGEGGEEIIEFKMAMNDPKRLDLGAEPVELIAQIGDKRFILRNGIDKRDDSGKKYTQFVGESLWYELRDAKVIEYEVIEQDAKTHIQSILDKSIEPTGWTVYVVKTDGRKRTIRGEWKSVLGLLLEVAEMFECELKFDTIDRTISLIPNIGEDNGVRFYYNKNLKNIEREVDTYSLITRLYLYGKNGMTIKSVHPQGLEYVENMTWVNALNLRKKIRIDRWSDSRYTIPQNLMDDGQKLVDEYGKPSVSYVMTVNDLSTLSGHEHESIGLGDHVYAIDTELLNLLIKSRIVRRKYNVRQVWKTEIELNQPKKTLADANKRALDDAIEILAESDPLDTTDVQQMTVFNHLLNSRAEDGIKYWEVTGTGIATEIGGFSGDASWKINSGLGATNILKQSIFGVSHRSAYTVSAYVGNGGTITRGTSQDAFVGIRVRIHYKEPDTDGKMYEDHYLAIPDITQENPGGA